MGGGLFVVAIALALVVMGAKRLTQWRVKKEWQAIPGHHPNNPVSITRFDEIDSHIEKSRCTCGGPWLKKHEGSKSSAHARCRVLHAECSWCEEEVDFFFDLEQMAH